MSTSQQLTLFDIPAGEGMSFFGVDEFTRSLGALSGIHPSATRRLQLLGAQYPGLSDELFHAMVHDLTGTAVESQQIRSLVAFIDVFRPLIIAVLQRMFRGTMGTRDLLEITQNAKRLEGLELSPTIQFAVYANLHKHASVFVRNELGTDEATPVIDAMSGYWMLTSAFFTEAFITTRRQREAVLLAETTRLTFESGLDPLTKLLNRSTLTRFELSLDASANVGLLFIDLDGFKQVNDQHGHLTGDALLCVVGQRILATVREPDLAIRFGGDEFLVVIRDAAGTDTRSVAKRLSEILNHPYELDGRAVRISASIGTTLLAPGEDLQVALERADKASYQAKRAGGGDVVSLPLSA